MATQSGGQQGWQSPNEDLAYTRLVPPDWPGNARPGLYEPRFEVFLIHYKSDSELGALANNDPLRFFREFIPEIARHLDRDEDVRATLVRINAERPANAMWIRRMVQVIGGSTTIFISDYKDEWNYEEGPNPLSSRP